MQQSLGVTRNVAIGTAAGYGGERLAKKYSKKKKAPKPTRPYVPPNAGVRLAYQLRRKPDGKAMRRTLGQPGTYGGKFNNNLVKRKVSMYEQRGFCSHAQKHGTQEQADCAWIGMRSVVEDQALFDLAIAFLRYIFKKHYGNTYTSINIPLAGWVRDLNLTGGSQPAKLPSFGGYSLEKL